VRADASSDPRHRQSFSGFSIFTVLENLLCAQRPKHTRERGVIVSRVVLTVTS